MFASNSDMSMKDADSIKISVDLQKLKILLKRCCSVGVDVFQGWISVISNSVSALLYGCESCVEGAFLGTAWLSKGAFSNRKTTVKAFAYDPITTTLFCFGCIK